MFRSNLVNIKNPMVAFVAGAAGRNAPVWAWAAAVTRPFEDSTDDTTPPEVLCRESGPGSKFPEHGHLTGQLHAVMVAVRYARANGADRLYVVEQDGRLPDETTEMYKTFRAWLEAHSENIDVAFLSRENLTSAPQRAMLDRTARAARNALSAEARKTMKER